VSLSVRGTGFGVYRWRAAALRMSPNNGGLHFAVFMVHLTSGVAQTPGAYDLNPGTKLSPL